MRALYFMRQLLNAYRFVNLLSIDIAAGAVVCAAFFARILEVRLYPQAYFVLGLTVWIIYTSDHLLDAWRLKGPASTDRHLFHQRFFRPLTVLVVVACVTTLVLAMFIRKQVMIPGLVMGFACAAYLLLSRWFRYAKELMATILYTGGVLLPALSLNYSPDGNQWLMVARFGLVVAINMLLFARMSYASDMVDRQPSFVTSAGPRITNKVIIVLFVVLAMTMIVPSDGRYVMEKLVLAAMGAVLLMIFLFPGYFASKERYRLVGDAVFLLPVFLFVSTGSIS
jgi:hypothetical protein